MATINIFGNSTNIGKGIDAIINPIGMGLDSLLNRDVNPANYILPTGRYVGLDDVLKRFHLGNEYGSESSNTVFSSGFEDPTYLMFKVEFGDWGYSLMNIEDIRSMQTTSKISNAYLMDYDQFPMGLLNVDYLDYSKVQTWSNQTLYNSYNYLMNRNEDSRAAYILTFTQGIYAIQKDMPYVFQKVTGLDSLQQLHVKEGKRLKDAKVTFECLEGIDMKIRTLLEAYRKAAVDDIWQRWLLPDIYRYFKMIIYVFDRRLLLTGTGTYSTDQDNFPIMAFECSPCEIDIQPTIDSEYSIVYGDHKLSTTKFTVNVKNVKTYYSNALFNKLNNTVKTNWFGDLETKSEKQDILSTDSTKNSNYKMRWMQRMFMINSEYNSFINKNIHKPGNESDYDLLGASYYISDYYWPQDTWHYAIVSDSILDVRSWKDFKNYMKHLVTSRKIVIRDSRTANKDVFVNDLWTPDYYTYRYDARFQPVRLDIRGAQQKMADTIRHMIKKMLDGIYVIDSTPDITLIDPGLEFNLEHIFQTYIKPIIDESKPVLDFIIPDMNISKQEQIIETNLIGGEPVHLEYVKPDMNLSKTDQEYVEPYMNLDKIDQEYVEPEFNLDKINQEYVEPYMNLDKITQTYIKPVQNLDKKKQKYVQPELKLEKPDQEYVEPEMNLDKQKQNYVEPELNLEKPDQEYVYPEMNLDKQKQRYVEPIINTDKPDQNLVNPIINDEKPVQEYIEPIINTDKPDQEYVEPIMDTSHIDMNMIEPVMNTSHIDMNMIEPVMDIHKTTMNMTNILDTSYHQGEMNFINPIIMDEHAHMNFINPIIDTHKTSMNMVETLDTSYHPQALNMTNILDTSYHQGEMEYVQPIDTSYHLQEQSMTNILDTSYHMDMNLVTPVLDISVPDMNMVKPVMNISISDMNMIVPVDTSYHQGDMELTVPIITDEHQQFNQMTVPVINDSKADADMIPLIGNVEKATMDMIPLVSETHKPEMDMMMLNTSTTLPEMDMTHLDISTTLPDMKMTKLDISTTLPDMKMTKLDISTTLPEMDMVLLDTSTTLPNMDMMRIDTSVTIPEMKMTYPNMNTSLPEMDMVLLDTDVSLPEMDMTELNPNVSIPVVPMVLPDMNVDKHISPMVEPITNTDIPVTPMVQPDMNTDKHSYPMVKPNDYNYDVTMEMARPKDEIKKDNDSAMVQPNITEYDHHMKSTDNIFENTKYDVSMNMTDNIQHPEKVTMDLVALPQDSSLATKIHMLTSLTEADVSKANLDLLLSLAEIIDTTVKQIKAVLGDMKMIDNKPNIPPHQHMQMVKIKQPARRLFIVDKLMKEVDDDALMRSLSNKKDRDDKDNYDNNSYTSQYRKGTAL